MIRLHVVAEGQTEEAFVNSVLADHLGAFDVSTDVRCVETSRDKRRIGLGAIRRRCPHFDEWLSRLEGLQVSRQQG